jgi:hypothetical protein
MPHLLISLDRRVAVCLTALAILMPYRPPVQTDRFTCGTRADGPAPILQISSFRLDASYRRHPGLSVSVEPSHRTGVCHALRSRFSRKEMRHEEA